MQNETIPPTQSDPQMINNSDPQMSDPQMTSLLIERALYHAAGRDSSRELSLVITKLEEALLWNNKTR